MRTTVGDSCSLFSAISLEGMAKGVAISLHIHMLISPTNLPELVMMALEEGRVGVGVRVVRDYGHSNSTFLEEELDRSRLGRLAEAQVGWEEWLAGQWVITRLGILEEP